MKQVVGLTRLALPSLGLATLKAQDSPEFQFTQ